MGWRKIKDADVVESFKTELCRVFAEMATWPDTDYSSNSDVNESDL